MRRLVLGLGLALTLAGGLVYAQINVANNAANLTGKTLLAAENADTVTGLLTYDRDPSAPFAVTSGSAKVSNLDADLLDGQSGDYYRLNPIGTVTSTGNQDNYAHGCTTDCTIRLNNASLLTIRGLVAGTSGQRIRLVAINAQVDLAHENANSTAANRMYNFSSAASTSLSPGTTQAAYAEYVYDGTTSRWRMIAHEQGGWLESTFAAGNFTGNGSMTWTVASGDVVEISYRLSGRSLSVAIRMNTTTVGGTLNNLLLIASAAIGGFTTTDDGPSSAMILDNGTERNGTLIPSAGGIGIAINNGSANWAAATDATAIWGSGVFRVN